jgi:hypothetical protein
MDEGQAGAGSPVVRAAQVRVTEETVRIGAPAQPHQGTPAGPTIRVVREGDAVKLIEVTCACGELIRIRCDY